MNQDIYFKRHRKRWLFNICFLIERRSIWIKRSSSNINCMINFFFMVNFIRDCGGWDILKERNHWRARGNLHIDRRILIFISQNSIQCCPDILWVFNRINKEAHAWRDSYTNSSNCSIRVIQLVTWLFIRLFTSSNRYLIETLSL